MRSKITIILAALALGGAMASTPAFAQNGKAANDGGIIAEPSGRAAIHRHRRGNDRAR